MAFIRWALLLLAPFAPYIPLCEAGMAYLNLSVLPGSAHIQQSYWSLPLDPDGERFRQRMKAMSAAQTPPNEPSFFLEWTNPHTDLNARDSDWSEKRLTKNLLKDYDCRSRPVIDHITPLIQVTPNLSVYQINVEFGLELLRILDLDEMDQVLTTSVRMLYRWKDYNFLWDPVDFDGIRFVTIPSDYIWLPDIALYNYADERLEERRSCDVRIHSDGTVIWSPMAIFKSTCAVDIKYFPFDKQKCSLKFGPWTHNGLLLNMSFYADKRSLQMTNYITNPEWVVVQSSAIFTEVRYECCPERYPDISFHLWLSRHSAIYTYILIVPSVLLSSLTSVIFWLPPESPSKIVLAMNVFVAFLLLHLLLENMTPSAASSFPLLGAYFCFNMGVITISMFLSCITVNLHFRADHTRDIPRWLLLLANSVGSMLLVNTECLRDALNSTNSPTQDTEIADDVSYTHCTSPETKSSRVPKRHSPKFTKPNYSAQESESKQDENPYKREQPINDNDTCWCLRAGISPKITPNCFHEQKVQTTLSSKACYSSVQSHLPDIARGEIKQIFKGSVGKENANLSERTQEEEDCELCLRMQSNRGLLRPSSSVASSINSSAQNGLKHALQSLSPNCEQNFQPNTPNQGLRNLFATYDQETHDQSASVNSTKNRFYIRLLGPNRVSRDSPIQTHERHWSEVSRGLLISDRIRQWQELKSTSARHRFLTVEKDVQYITKTISRIESEKKERDCNARVAEQWRTICLALDRVFFLIYLITLIFSMCLFHPTVMSSLENMKV
ncbi:Neuronal acetylcholine receptor subunit alpha-2 [Fasciola hepatica]|uniref:Neuronal acetylcholine receptor subunit alpha-2 n=1 Tax=Fasciola hepatica TaxID=6192 RepID=A0A4E0RDL0_FASHE|nr:Neuronal acetylcholine receptor subunit alpha-2 [Fasciola hepatica]